MLSITITHKQIRSQEQHFIIINTKMTIENVTNDRIIAMKNTVSNIRGQQSRQQKKSVSFKTNVLVYHTKHINEYTKEEIRNCWYDDKEMGFIVSDCMAIIKLMVKDEEQLISSSDCVRGLEYRTPEGQKRRMSNKFCAMDKVLDEQDMQWQHNKNNVDELREIYSAYSEPSHNAAHLIGLEDERQAMIIYREDDCSVKNTTRQISKVISHDQHQIRNFLRGQKEYSRVIRICG